ncbi:ABC transporter permease [Nitrosomonas communis]|uniref:ABC transporter permease n=1 Tax=Nitrosomonas communis TaxID=44574 RepID=UPI003D2BA1EE
MTTRRYRWGPFAGARKHAHRRRAFQHIPVTSAAMLASNVDRWLWWDWIGRNTDLITTSLTEHVILAAAAVGLGVAIALPLGVASNRWPRIYGPSLAITGIMFTIPSLAAFAFLIPYTGLSRTTALIPLTSYTLLILLRNVVAGLAAVPADIKDAADGMGFSRTRRLLRVELPLALPAIMAGVRIATVTIIGLAAVAGLLAIPSLGNLIYIGQNRPIRTAVTVGVVLSIALAVLADLLLAVLQRWLTPWTRARS